MTTQNIYTFQNFWGRSTRGREEVMSKIPISSHVIGRGGQHRRRKWARLPFGPPESITMIVVSPELIATDAWVGLALRSIILHGSRTLEMFRVEPGRPFGPPGPCWVA